VLFDEFYSLITGTESEHLTFDIKIRSDKLRGIKLTGPGGLVSGASYESGGLYLFAITDSGASLHPKMKFTSRVYFKDS